jgi:hypothetical protein
MLTYLWLEMNLLVLIMSNLFLQVSSQPAICLFFFYYAVTLVWQTQPAPAPRTGDQQPARSGGAQDRRPAASQDRRQSSQPGPVVWTGDNAAKGSAQACEPTRHASYRRKSI